MGTRLIIGAILTVAGFIIIAICYLGSRNPSKPRWTSEIIMGSFIIPLSIGGMVMGPMLMGEAMWVNGDSLTSFDTTVAFSILAAGVIILLMMRIPKRAAAYDALSSAAEKMEDKRQRTEMPDVSDNSIGQGA